MIDPDEIVRAHARARRLYPRAKHYQNAYLAGARAKLNGQPESHCPYAADPSKTWLVAWRRAWMRGHHSIESLGEG